MNIKSILIVLLTLIILIINKTAAQTLSGEEIYKRCSPSVLYLISYDFKNKPSAIGSGVIINKEGLIATNYHIFENMQNIAAIFGKDTIKNLSVVAADVLRDILILYDETNKLNASAELGNSDSILVGETIFAIGNPEGLEKTFSDGRISGKRYDPYLNRDIIQISAPISHGSSGGGLFNSKGQLIGITYSGFKEGQNLNFAIPINDYLKIRPSNFKNISEITTKFYKGYNALQSGNYEESLKYFLIIEGFLKDKQKSKFHGDFFFLIGEAYSQLKNSQKALYYFNEAIKIDSNFVEGYNRIGSEHMFRGELDVAENYFNKSILLDPNFAPAYSNKGSIFLMNNNLDDALFFFNKAIQINKYFATAYNNIGVLLNKKASYNESIKYHLIALQIEPNIGLYYLGLANSYFDKEEYDSSKFYVEKAIKLDKMLDKAYILLIDIYCIKEEYKMALEQCEVFLELYPRSFVGYNKIGQIHIMQNNYDQSLQFFNKALAVNPKDPSTYYYLGRLYFSIKNFDSTKIFLNKAIENDSSYSAAYKYLGYVKYAELNFEDAITTFHKALELNQYDYELYWFWGDTYRALCKFDSAIIFYNRALSLNDKKEEILYDLGVVYERLNDDSEAIKYYKKSFEKNKKFYKSYIVLSSLYLKKNLYDEAIEILVYILNLGCFDPGLYNNLAIAFINKKDFISAKVYLEDGLRKNPEDEGIMNSLSKVFYYLDEIKTAIKYAQQAARLGSKEAQDWLTKSNLTW
ncbi:MAG: hypothetical protein A2V93_05770 [Ignavibacteria bacterium RBG_16_34_14]|nr:MAG: hypothetical protein A2V93_05770 [Ignavibacteria bacterium RBG_16_34_14]